MTVFCSRHAAPAELKSGCGSGRRGVWRSPSKPSHPSESPPPKLLPETFRGADLDFAARMIFFHGFHSTSAGRSRVFGESGVLPTPANCRRLYYRHVCFRILSPSDIAMSTPASTGQIDSVMQETRLFPPSTDFSAKAVIGSMADYEKLYAESMPTPRPFGRNKLESNFTGSSPSPRRLNGTSRLPNGSMTVRPTLPITASMPTLIEVWGTRSLSISKANRVILEF